MYEEIRGSCPRVSYICSDSRRDRGRYGLHWAPIALKTVVLVCVFLFSGHHQAAALQYTLAPFEPETGCYIGAYIDLEPAVGGDIAQFQQLVGKRHATVFRYVGYGQPFPFEWVRELKAAGVAPHIAWEPNKGLAAVQDDDYLRGWAEAARRAEVPIFLRYASEMNGTWEAWSGDPDEYVRKWRIVHRVMKQVAPNVVMMWCPFATPRTTIPRYYPGDEYVDWVGVNIYSVARQDGDISRPPSEDPVSLLSHVYNLYSERKPIAIAEYAASHHCLAQRLDVTDFAVQQMTRLYQALPTQFPRVRMINWFSVDTIGKNLANNNYSLASNPRVLETYRELISDPYFLSTVVDSGGGAAMAMRPVPGTGPVETSVPLAADDLGPAELNEVWVAIIGAPAHAVSGTVEIAVQVPSGTRGATVSISVDGRFQFMSNVAPHRYQWDTSRWPAGERIIEVEVTDERGRMIGRKQVSAIVVQE